jgi:hypothetical protein
VYFNLGDKIMKKLILTLMICLIMGTSSVFAASWYYVCSTTRQTIYIDNESVNKNSANAIVWLKAVYPHGNIQLLQMFMSRNNRVCGVMREARYVANGQLLMDRTYSNPQWAQAIPGSVIDQVFQLVW